MSACERGSLWRVFAVAVVEQDITKTFKWVLLSEIPIPDPANKRIVRAYTYVPDDSAHYSHRIYIVYTIII